MKSQSTYSSRDNKHMIGVSKLEKLASSYKLPIVGEIVKNS
ncbi:hypothetical protein [Halobacteriovorax sp. YZS-3-1]